MNRYMMPDLQSMKMVLDTMGGKNYKVIRQNIYDFDVFGRAVNTQTIETIYGVLSKDSMRLEMKETGDWINSEYSFTIIYPDVLHQGDVIINTNNEKLRVMSQSSMHERGGVSSYSLIREGSYEKIMNRDQMDPKDEY